MPKSDAKSEARVRKIRPDAALRTLHLGSGREAKVGYVVVSLGVEVHLPRKTAAEAWRSALGRLTS